MVMLEVKSTYSFEIMTMSGKVTYNCVSSVCTVGVVKGALGQLSGAMMQGDVGKVNIFK